MDTINKLNLRSCRTYFRRAGESNYFILANLVQGYFQYCLKSLEIVSVRDRIIVVAFSSGAEAIMTVTSLIRECIGKAKVLKNGMLSWQEIYI